MSLRIQFGPEHDVRHIDSDDSGAFEWWYFDALSDDGRYALVAIYFLGSPMSPYYKSVVEGKRPLPRDWCGVFFSLHENRGERWHERAYAYNLYEEKNLPLVPGGGTGGWKIGLGERGLWRGSVRADLTFVAVGDMGRLTGLGDEGDGHTWVCVAPQCAVEGVVSLARGEEVVFTGTGYHDHNYGRLPYGDTDLWYWGRVHLCADGTSETRDAIFYQVVAPGRGDTGFLMTLDAQGTVRDFANDVAVTAELVRRSPYGLRHANRLTVGGAFTAVFRDRNGAFSEGPFYRRLPLEAEARWEGRTWRGTGIGEVFRPAGLCGPIASRALWSRLRRRRRGDP